MSGTSTAPTQVTLWSPQEVARSIENAEFEDRLASTGLVTTRRGDRAAIYETQDGRGIVGYFDFSAGMQSQDAWGEMAQGVLQPLDEPVSRTQLLDDPVLAPVFQHIRGRRALNRDQARRIEELTGPVVQELIEGPTDGWDFDGPTANQETSYGQEAAMEAAILDDPHSWRALGFTSKPRAQRRSDDGKQRYDLISEEQRLVAELKIEATLQVLPQVDSYLEVLEVTRGPGWQVRIVSAAWPSAGLTQAVRARPELELWRCHRGPFLERVDV